MNIDYVMSLADAYAGRFGAYRLSQTGLTLSEYQQARAALEAALSAKQGEPDTRCKIKLGSQYGSDLAGHWFFLRPADEHAEAALAKHSGITLPAPEVKQEPRGCNQWGEPIEAWTAYAKRSGLLDADGVATDRQKAQTAYYAYSAAWDESYRFHHPAPVNQQLLEALEDLARYADTCELFLRETHPGKAASLGARVTKAISAISKAKGTV